MKVVERAIVAVLVLGSFLGAKPAFAQRSERRQSLRLYNQASRDYRAGRFEAAAQKLETAYGLYPEPILLYNLARALEGSGDLEGAKDSYQLFLDAADEDAEERPASLARIEVIEGLLEALRPDDPEPEPEENEEIFLIEEGASDDPAMEDPPGYGLPIGFAVAAVVVAGAGVPFLLRASSKSNEADDPSTSQDRVMPLVTQARRNSVGSIALFAAGGALAITSIALFVVRKNQRAQVSLSPTSANVLIHF